MNRIEHKRGKIVVITGASAGIGRAAVRRFAAEGYDVGLIARGHDGLAAAAAEVEDAGQRALDLTLRRGRCGRESKTPPNRSK